MPDIHAETVRRMSEYILSRLDGSNEACKRTLRDANPARYYIVGSLANIVEKNGASKSSVQENAITLKFILTEARPICIRITYSVFVKDDLTNSEIAEGFDNKHAWNRIDFEDVFTISNDLDCHKLSFKNDNCVVEGYDATVEYSEEMINHEKHISICVHNDSKSEYSDKYLFNTRMVLKLGESDIVPFQYDYIYEGVKKQLFHPFRAINCTAEFNRDKTEIVTAPYSTFTQNKVKLKDSDKGLALSFDKLSSDQTIDYLKKYDIILKEYLCEYEKIEIDPSDEIEFNGALSNYSNMCTNYENGVKLLEKNDAAKLAFKLMNETFRRSSTHSAWRMFQIVYIVSSIPSIVLNDNNETCDVIHIPTGGGKTEAYLGLVLFTIFYVRIIGKKYGTVAIVKFPLRMLSIQQVERVAKKIMVAEKIRKENELPGEEFSSAFFVGSSDEFPNKTKDAIDAINNVKPNNSSGKILTICPLCEGDLVLREINNSQIVHRCLKCNTDHRLYYTDEEIYRYLPTVIISTVDKFSTVAWNRHVKSLFGSDLTLCECGHGFVPVGEGCLVKQDNKECKCKKQIVDMNTVIAPMIIVQDELHLIRESFGTIDAHFESFCEELQKTLKNTVPKRIAMTATITGCSEQIQQLYNKKANIFPGPNPYSVANQGSMNNPFFENEMDEYNPKLHRLIVGLKPNGRDNQYATNLSIKYAKEFINKLYQNEIEFPSEFDMSYEDSRKLAELYCCMLTYHNQKADAFATNHFMDAVVTTKNEPGSIIKKTLTGENSADEIRSVIKSVNEFKKSDDEQLHVTLATSIVSHGVDIDKWNFMQFQGIPNNIAEYIQAMSRVGRKYSGLVFVWFYPNRARDTSFYHNFQEYHEIIDHKIEPVSINKWTKLSLMETCTSIFCATVMNYLSAKYKIPIYNREQFVNLFGDGRKPQYKDEVIEFMHKVYHTDYDTKGAAEIRREIQSIIESRIKYILESPPDIEKNYFPNILLTKSDKYFGMQHGMRGIQESVILSKDRNTIEYQNRVCDNEK